MSFSSLVTGTLTASPESVRMTLDILRRTFQVVNVSNRQDRYPQPPSKEHLIWVAWTICINILV